MSGMNLMITGAIGKAVMWEYILVMLMFLFAWFVLPLSLLKLADVLDRNKPKNQFGVGMFFALLIPMINILVGLFVLIANPIRILVRNFAEIKAIEPMLARIGMVVLILLPIPLLFLFIFPTALSDFLFRRKYERAKGKFRAAPDQYKTPAEFRDELTARGLYFDREKDAPLYDRMLRKYKQDKDFSLYSLNDGYYYTPGTMMALDGNEFYDAFKQELALDPDTAEPQPAYIYNAILGLNEDTGKLEYMPLGRYGKNGYMHGRCYPLFKDFYVECKILDVNGDIYAIIGVDECFTITDHIGIGHFERPFYMVVAEKEAITTYIEGVYYPDGAIGMGKGRIEMLMNTVKRSWAENYPVRKVERIDIDTLNAIAAELQENELAAALKRYRERQAEGK